MPDVRFDDSRSFDKNLETFLTKTDDVDAEMAAILRTNIDDLAAITTDGQVSHSARGEFNQAVTEALDALLADEEGG